MIRGKTPVTKHIERNFDRPVYFVAFPEHVGDIREHGICSNHSPDEINGLCAWDNEKKNILLWDRMGIQLRHWHHFYKYWNELALVEIDVMSIDAPVLFDLNDFVNVYWTSGWILPSTFRRILTGHPEELARTINDEEEQRVEAYESPA